MYKHLSFLNPNKVVLVPEDNAWQCKSAHSSACSQPEPPPSTRNAAMAALWVSEQNIAYPNKCDLTYQT